MRFYEFLTMYLAVGAPFGVARFLRGVPGSSAARLLAEAGATWLLFPLEVFSLPLFKRASAPAKSAMADKAQSPSRFASEARLVSARGDFLHAVHTLEDEVGARARFSKDGLWHALRELRAAYERYTGLRLAVAELTNGSSCDAAPAFTANAGAASHERVAALARLAGRTGDDLALAALCIDRRNARRLLAHCERSRADFVNALAAARTVTASVTASHTEFARSPCRASEMLLHLLAASINLASLLDDPLAALSISCLLDAECARLRRLPAVVNGEADADDADAFDYLTLTPASLARSASEHQVAAGETSAHH